MRVQTYLQDELSNCSLYTLTDADDELIAKEGIEAYIFTKLASKKFRKWALDEASNKQIRGAIAQRVSQHLPIRFTFPFGGYKLWQLQSAPEVDWAEFFTICYYTRWIAPVASGYKPGVHFVFSSDDVIVEKMDNIPPADTKRYFASFKTLLDSFKQYFPDNLTMELTRVGDLYSPEEFESELAQNLKVMTKAYENPDPDRYQKMLTTSALNIQWQGEQDWTTLSKAEKEKKIASGPIMHDAYGKLTKRRQFVRAADTIVAFTTPIPNAIAIGTTKTSVTKFWTGVGVLEKRGDSFADRILSPEQLKQMKPTNDEKINLIDLPNLKSIQICGELNFSKPQSQNP